MHHESIISSDKLSEKLTRKLLFLFEARKKLHPNVLRLATPLEPIISQYKLFEGHFV